MNTANLFCKKRKSFSIIFLLSITLLETLIMTPSASAKAAYSSLADMLVNSEIIAVVNVKKVEKVEERGTSFTFSEKATADVEQIIKGSPAKQINIFGGENFICASCQLTPGKLLVFLNHDHDMLIGSNWHLSIRPIANEQLDWFSGDSVTVLKPAKLNTVLSEIKSKLPRPIKLVPPFSVISEAESLDDEIIGEAPEASKSWQAYKAILPVASRHQAELESILSNGKQAGRIYAAMLLYHAAKEKEKATGKDKQNGEPNPTPNFDPAKAALITLCRCNATVHYKSGCRGTIAGVWDVAEKLYSSGKYMNLKL